MATQYPTEREEFQFEIERLKKINVELVVELNRRTTQPDEDKEQAGKTGGVMNHIQGRFL